MSTNTPAVNNLNKVQTVATNPKFKSTKKDTELNFNDLFSSALGQTAPKVQLNSIESQLRETLFKQEKPKKNTDENSNPDAVQSAVWEQRNWMQTAQSPQNQANSDETSNRIEPQKDSPTDPVKFSENNGPNKSDPVESGKQEAQTDNADKASEENNSQALESAQSNRTSSTANSVSTTDTPATSTEIDVTLAQAATTNTASATASANSNLNQATTLPNGLTSSSTTESTQITVDTNSTPGIDDLGAIRLDSTSGNTSVNMRTEQQAQGMPNNQNNTNALTAQLAPQIAQQTQNVDLSLETEGLKVGQKILAAGNLQASGMNYANSAGINGVNNNLGTAQPPLIKTPVNQPGFVKELSQTVQWAIGKNMSTVDIRVNPESFGPMNMRFVQKGQQVQLIIRTQDEASANLLTQALGGLKEAMAQSGLQLNQVQIQHNNTANTANFANTANSQGQTSNGQGHRGQNSSGQNTSPEQELALSPTTHSTGKKPDGTLDLFA